MQQIGLVDGLLQFPVLDMTTFKTHVRNDWYGNMDYRYCLKNDSWWPRQESYDDWLKHGAHAIKGQKKNAGEDTFGLQVLELVELPSEENPCILACPVILRSAHYHSSGRLYLMRATTTPIP